MSYLRSGKLKVAIEATATLCVGRLLTDDCDDIA